MPAPTVGQHSEPSPWGDPSSVALRRVEGSVRESNQGSSLTPPLIICPARPADDVLSGIRFSQSQIKVLQRPGISAESAADYSTDPVSDQEKAYEKTVCRLPWVGFATDRRRPCERAHQKQPPVGPRQLCQPRLDRHSRLGLCPQHHHELIATVAAGFRPAGHFYHHQQLAGRYPAD